jgi:hypothetical protein
MAQTSPLMFGAKGLIAPVVALNDMRLSLVTEGVVCPPLATELNAPPAYIVSPIWWKA